MWKAEKAAVEGTAQFKEELERARAELETARRAHDLARMSELQYGRIPQLEKDPTSFEFRQPVDWKAYGLVDYLDIIKKPMDLATLKRNLTRGRYGTADEFFQDL